MSSLYVDCSSEDMVELSWSESCEGMVVLNANSSIFSGNVLVIVMLQSFIYFQIIMLCYECDGPSMYIKANGLLQSRRNSLEL